MNVCVSDVVVYKVPCTRRDMCRCDVETKRLAANSYLVNRAQTVETSLSAQSYTFVERRRSVN